MLRRAVLGVALSLGLVLASGCNLNSEPIKADAGKDAAGNGARVSKGIAPQIGYTAPEFTLKDLDGKNVSLSDFKGRVVLLNFWATWCGPCRIEMPTLQALTEDYAELPFVVVAVAGDFEGRSKVAPFMEGMGLTFPGLIDQDGRIQDLYYVNALPMTYVLDRQGTVVYKMVGFFDWNQKKFRDLVEGLIAEA
jgi:peroxiredoxin